MMMGQETKERGQGGGMEADAEWEAAGRKAFDRAAAEARSGPPRVERLAYRVPGTTSVSAQPDRESGEPPGDPGRQTERGPGSAPPAASHASAAYSSIIAGLEERLRASEAARAAGAAESERLLREGREAIGTAVEEARRESERRAKAELERAARQIGVALESFRREREEYFAKVEREVVELALAIAARILHREALLDPMLLAGAVRVALGQLGETTGVRLRCPANQVEQWRSLLDALPLAPEIAADAALQAGDCVLEAKVGVVDLGVRAQLAEIERGFFDLLEQRPGTGHRAQG